jgi:hypothetical protein
MVRTSVEEVCAQTWRLGGYSSNQIVGSQTSPSRSSGLKMAGLQCSFPTPNFLDKSHQTMSLSSNSLPGLMDSPVLRDRPARILTKSQMELSSRATRLSWLQQSDTLIVRTVESCFGMILEPDGVKVHIRYMEQILAASQVLLLASQLSTEPRKLVQS